MKKRILFWAAAVSVLTAQAAFAAGWQNGVGANAGKWWYATNDAGTTWHTNGWQWIDGDGDGVAECYYFGPDGYIYTSNYTPDGYAVDKDGKWTVNGTIQTRNVGTAAGNASGNGSGASMSGGIAETYGRNGSWKNGEGANAGKWWFDNGDGTFRKDGWQWLDGNKDGVAECYYFDNDGWLIANGKTPDGYTVNSDGAWIKDGVKQTRSSGLKTSTGTSGYASFGGGGGGGSSSGGGGGSSSGGSASSTTSGGSSSSGSSTTGGNSSITISKSERPSGSESETAAESREIAEAIADFKAEYITDDMSDIEKEMAIIKWLASHVIYADKSEKIHTAYGAIINGEAVCDGYSYAFEKMAKACGLEVKTVMNMFHAWNIVKIAGKWYHVDVTWADGDSIHSQTSPDWINTQNINLTDDEVKKLSNYHAKGWSPSNIKCTGGEYGQSYFKALKQAELDKKTEEELKKLANNKYGYQVLEYTTTDETASKAAELVKNKKISKHGDIMRSQTVCYVHVNSTSFNKVKSAVSELETAISEKIQPFAEQYRAENSYKSAKIHFQESYDSLPNGTYYVTLQSFVDIADKEYKYSYKINYIDADDKTTVISTESGIKDREEGEDTVTGAKKIQINFENIPEGYEVKSSEIVSGSIFNKSKTGFLMYLDKDAEVNAYVSKIKEPTRVNYTINYVSVENNEVVGTQTGTVTETTGVKYEPPEGYHVTSVIGNYGKVLTGNGGINKKQAGVVVKEGDSEDYTAIVYVGKDYTSSSAKASVIEIIDDEEETETVTYEVAEEEPVEEEAVTEEASETAAETETDLATETEKSED